MSQAYALARRNPADLLLSCSSWAELSALLAQASEAVKGAVFEMLVQAYLKLQHPEGFVHVWSTHGEVPRAIRLKLNLHASDVAGIDLVAETRRGTYWAVQCKYHQDPGATLTREEATGLIAGLNRGPFEFGLVCTTVNRRSSHLRGEPRVGFEQGDVWRGLGPKFWTRLHQHLRGLVPAPPDRKRPKRHQVRALRALRQAKAAKRGQVVMPCGSGKSLIGYCAAQDGRTVLVTVPNLSLVRQLLSDWAEQNTARGVTDTRFAVVCSDQNIAERSAAQDLGVFVHTDPREVAKWIRANEGHRRVIFTTYQSGRVLADAARKAGVVFDVGVFDEAHRTAGAAGRPFGLLLADKNVRIKRRIFMTATPRIYSGTRLRREIVCMSDSKVYGPRVHEFSFRAAMDAGVITELRILATIVTDAEIQKLKAARAYVDLQDRYPDDVVEISELISALALRKAMQKYPIRRTLGFYNSIKRAKRALEIQNVITRCFPKLGPLDGFHVNGGMSAAERKAVLDDFKRSDHALLTNDQVFAEGIDCPSLDAVLFAEPRQSTIEIVQAIGRALRVHTGKSAGYALVPAQIAVDGTTDDAAFDQLVRIAAALSSVDETIAEYFAARAQGKPWTGRRVFDTFADVEIGRRIDLRKLHDAVALRVWERTCEWRPFTEARKFVRKLGLSGEAAWVRYCASGKKPADIPSNPQLTHKDDGWINWGDWLGTGTMATRLRQYRPFPTARKFVRSLGLGGQNEWGAYCRNGEKPNDIPAHPDRTYRDAGWINWGDWLGTDRRRDGWMPFPQAKSLARKLGLKNQEQWFAYAKSGKKPKDIPSTPSTVYAGDGWASWGDWLGTDRIADRDKVWLPFPQARAFVQKRALKSAAEWRAYCASGKKPADIPTAPNLVYKDDGWVNWGDWLGHASIQRRGNWRPFERARAFVRSQEIKTVKEWQAYCRSGKKPADIPAQPDAVYADDGWAGYGDWLGTGAIAAQLREYRLYKPAQEFVHPLGLKSSAEWYAYARSGKKPDDIPAAPDQVYKHKGWISWGDWLGTGTVEQGRGRLGQQHRKNE
jgi:superfamily II DNA or RNA helicase